MEIQGNIENKSIKFLLFICKINVLSFCFNNNKNYLNS